MKWLGLEPRHWGSPNDPDLQNLRRGDELGLEALEDLGAEGIGVGLQGLQGFPSWGNPNNGWFRKENSIKMDDDWGYPHLWKPPFSISEIK